MHRKLIREIINRNDTAIMQELETIVLEMMDELKITDKKKYKDIEYKMYKLLYGHHLNENLATKWVSEMENKDGSFGEHWAKSQTDQYAGVHDKWDWYASMNMVYSDLYNPKFDTSVYVELAKDWLDDKDVGVCKALNYYWYVVD